MSLPLVHLRLKGLQIVSVFEEPRLSTASSRQFSLGYLMAWMTSVAAVLGLIRFCVDPAKLPRDYYPWGALAITGVLELMLAGSCLYAALGKHFSVPPILPLVCVCVLIVCCCRSFRLNSASHWPSLGGCRTVGLSQVPLLLGPVYGQFPRGRVPAGAREARIAETIPRLEQAPPGGAGVGWAGIPVESLWNTREVGSYTSPHAPQEPLHPQHRHETPAEKPPAIPERLLRLLADLQVLRVFRQAADKVGKLFGNQRLPAGHVRQTLQRRHSAAGLSSSRSCANTRSGPGPCPAPGRLSGGHLDRIVAGLLRVGERAGGRALLTYQRHAARFPSGRSPRRRP